MSDNYYVDIQKHDTWKRSEVDCGVNQSDIFAPTAQQSFDSCMTVVQIAVFGFIDLRL